MDRLSLLGKFIANPLKGGPKATIRRLSWILLQLTYYLPKNRIGDRIFGMLWFCYSHGRLPAIGDNNSLNDVLYRIKCGDEITRPLRVFVSDKEYEKLYIKAVLGEEYIVPTVAVLRSPSEVDNYVFPENCCIKPTQYSGIVILRRDGLPIDKEYIKSWFSLNYYDRSREANYRTLQPKVIVEPILNFDDVLDYKLFCYDGVPKVIQVGLKKDGQDLRRYFDLSWNELGVTRKRVGNPVPHYRRPDKLGEMVSLATTLSRPFSLIRVDLYDADGKVLVGEMTNCHWSAHDDFGGKELEGELSRHIFRGVCT